MPSCCPLIKATGALAAATMMLHAVSSCSALLHRLLLGTGTRARAAGDSWTCPPLEASPSSPPTSQPQPHAHVNICPCYTPPNDPLAWPAGFACSAEILPAVGGAAAGFAAP